MKRSKIALIGGGQIGGILALLTAQRELGDAIVLDVAEKENYVKGKTLDIAEGTPHIGSSVKVMGTSRWDDVNDADVTIITAGVPRKPGMSREDLLGVNLGIVKDIAQKCRTYCPDAFHIVLTNPLDAMVYAFSKVSNLSTKRIVGMAGVLDTGRFRSFVATELGVSPEDVSATVLGGHGPTMVPLPRLCTVGGIPLTELMSAGTIDAIVERTRRAGTEVVQLLGNGSAYFSPALSAIEMAEAYLKDKKRVIPCAAHLDGEYGIKGYFIGVPAIIGGNGVEKILEVKLTGDEQKALDLTFERVRATTLETGL